MPEKKLTIQCLYHFCSIDEQVIISMNYDIKDIYRVMDAIENESDITQRRLAIGLGYSLGKTNYLLKGLLEKGLIKANNLRKSHNKLGYVYVLTPEGISEKLKVTIDYLKRREEEYDLLQAEIEQLKKKIIS